MASLVRFKEGEKSAWLLVEDKHPMFQAAHGMVTFKIQSDNGKFKSAKCRELIESCAGQLLTNAPYSPETMAIIERSWRTIEEMASVMPLNADLEEEF